MAQTVLLVEDNSPNAAFVKEALLGSSDGSFTVERVRKCSEARERLSTDGERAIAVVIANLFLPDSQGLQTIDRIFEVAPRIPLLVLTNADHEHIAVQAVLHGAQDYVLQHRLDSYLLPRVLHNMLYRATYIEALDAQNELAPGSYNSNGDVVHDHLTGLPNSLLLSDRLSQAIAFARRQQQSLAVLSVDIDRFKHVNDALGREIGDHLLCSIARRLLASVRNTDTVSRQGGDEFIVLLSGLAHCDDAALSAQKMLTLLSMPHCIEQHNLQITATIGIGIYPDNGSDAGTLVRNAGSAMITAKAQGTNSYGFFKPHMNELAIERRFLECGLRHALERQEFVLYYQPQMDLQTEAIVGAEASIRWRRPKRGIVLPAEFMSTAEQSGHSIQIRLWALREACRQVRHWRDAGLASIPVAITISAIELRSEGFAENVRGILHETGMEPQNLELAITELALVQHQPAMAAVLHTLRDSGVHIVLEHFGTGSSSLTQLKHLPVDALKVDESLVHALCTRDAVEGIVNAVISTGKCFHLRVIAQGIETRGQFLALRNMQCPEGQGRYCGGPVPANEFAGLLKDHCCTTPVA
jgi:diguanylate cyclase